MFSRFFLLLTGKIRRNDTDRTEKPRSLFCNHSRPDPGMME